MGASSGGAGRAPIGGNTPHPAMSGFGLKGGKPIISPTRPNFKGQAGFAPASSGGSKNPPSKTTKLK